MTPAERKRVPQTAVRLAAACLGCLASAGAWAQQTCEVVLRDAERFFQEGRIAYVYAVREVCLEGKATRAEQVRAWAVLARAYVADDKLGRAAAAVETLIGLDPEFSPAAMDAITFVRLVEREKQKLTATPRVATVSKVDEPLREAPATVIVLTAEEIERRGYLDLEEIFHDLPGFDISRGNGDVYSNIYMRGYRSDRSDRMMLLIDGIEQNDLHSNTAYVSRQYPLSYIEQIEVVYGPASTIYGPNAFNGVVSITTKAPAAFLEEGRNLGYAVTAGGGSFQTGFFDATVAGRYPRGRLSWSVTGRSFRSDEQDLSGFPDWDYRFELPDLETYRELITVFGFDLDDEELERARQLDQRLLNLLQARQDDLLRFSDETDDWFFSGKLQIENLTFGVQTWRREEGTAPWYTELLRAGSGNVLTPKQTSIYLRYARSIGPSLSLTVFSRYKEHELDGDSSIARFALYANGFYDDLALVAEKQIPFFERIDFDQISTQLRNEVTLVYQPSAKFNLVGGVELRNSSIQADFVSESTEQTFDEQELVCEESLFGQFCLNDPFFFTEEPSRRELRSRDLGLFAQLSFKLVKNLKLVLGGRLDNNSVREAGSPANPFSVLDDSLFDEAFDECAELFEDFDAFFDCFDEFIENRLAVEGFGSVFNGRAALVYSVGDFVLKGIYSEAFKDSTNYQRYTREPFLREAQNPFLKPEEVDNFELALSWEPSTNFSLDLIGYESRYTQSPALRGRVVGFLIPSRTAGFENLSNLRIRGLQASALWKRGDLEIFGNYTYTDPTGTISSELDSASPETGRIGDVARHRLNLGAHLRLGKQFALNLRANYVSSRKTGAGTTVPNNPFDEIDTYLVVNGALTYRGPRLLPGASWQLIVRNLFDEEYYHPGVQLASSGLAARLPQPGRSVYLRFVYKR